MKKILVLALAAIVLWTCRDKKKEEEEDMLPGDLLLDQPFSLNIDPFIQLYSSSTGTVNGRVLSEEVPKFTDLLYSVNLFRENEFQLLQRIETYNFTIEEINDRNDVIHLSLDPEITYQLRLEAHYMLTPDDVNDAHAVNLETEQMMVHNATNDHNPPDTTVEILKRVQVLPNLAFGKFNLGRLFELRSANFSPNPQDTLGFILNHDTLTGPRIFDINIDNSMNPSIPGSLFLRIQSFNTPVFTININEMPDELFIAKSFLNKIEIIYVEPEGDVATILQKDNGLGGLDLVFFALNITIPHMQFDENENLESAIHTGTEFMGIRFSEELYKMDTINLGD